MSKEGEKNIIAYQEDRPPENNTGVETWRDCRVGINERKKSHPIGVPM